MADVVNNLPGLWFSGVTRNVPNLHFPDTLIS
jgi:hypothetical protein